MFHFCYETSKGGLTPGGIALEDSEETIDWLDLGISKLSNPTTLDQLSIVNQTIVFMY
jgi:hypothetical protein